MTAVLPSSSATPPKSAAAAAGSATTAAANAAAASFAALVDGLGYLGPAGIEQVRMVRDPE